MEQKLDRWIRFLTVYCAVIVLVLFAVLVFENQYYTSNEGFDTVAEIPVSEKVYLVNINTANTEQLCELPGIGDTLAKRIIEYRESNGPFADSRELMRVSGIGEGIFQNLKELISV